MKRAPRNCQRRLAEGDRISGNRIIVVGTKLNAMQIRSNGGI